MPPDSHSLVGRRVDRYDVLSQLGQGGFGAVYRARHTVLGTEVALKVLWPDRASDPTCVERFLREAQAAASIGDPHIAQVGDAGSTPDGVVFLTMELLQGRDLKAEMDQRGRLPPLEAVEVTRQALMALAAAHRRGIVHRDLKPANVFLVPGPDGAPFVKLLDFGISKAAGSKSLTQTGTALGTPHYMAPEQIGGRLPVDGRADVYAAGAMLYQMLAGRLPFDGGGVDLLMRRMHGESPRPLQVVAPDVPEPLARVVQRALMPDRDARWPSADAMIDALLAAEDGAAEDGAEEAAPAITLPPAVRWAGQQAGAPGPHVHVGGPLPTPWPSPSYPPPAARSGSQHPAATQLLPETTPSSATSSPYWDGGSAHPPTSPSYRPVVVSHSSPYPHPYGAPPVPSRAIHPALWAGLGAVAILLVVVTGAVGVGLHRRYGAAPAHPPPIQIDVAPPAPSPALPAAPAPLPAPAPAALPAPAPLPSAPSGPDPDLVRYRIVDVGGRGPRSEVVAVLARARAEVARCARPSEPTHVAVGFIATTGGAITIAHPSHRRPSDDDATAQCVASAIRSAGPLSLSGWETALVEVDVDLPAG